jgi:adenylyl- and sulfurtransferase ThiI
VNTAATIIGAGGVPNETLYAVIVLVSGATVVGVAIWIIVQVRGILRSERSNDADEV